MASLPARTDTVVVGGGITGASLAYHLAERGPRVVLLERDTIAAGPTGRSTAIVRTHYSQPLLVEMALAGLRMYANFEPTVGASSGFVRSGVLWLVGPDDRPALEANVTLGRDAGAPMELLEPAELATIDSRIATDGVGGACWEPESGYCDPYLAAAGFVGAAERLGACVLAGTRAERVGPGIVETTAGRIECDTVVVAAGPWTPALLEPLGCRPPIVAARAEVGRYRTPASFGDPPPALAEMTGRGFYFKPGEPGYLEVGTLDPSHADEPIDPDECPEGAEPETLSAFETLLEARLPPLAGGHWRGAWSGVYDVTPDWQPVLGPVPGVDGIYVAAGFSGHGFKLAPAVGACLAALIGDGRWHPLDLSLFDPARFERDELIESRYGYSVVG